MQYAEEFEGLMLAVKLLTLLISMMALSHVGCCLWYGVGNIDDCGQWSVSLLHRSILFFFRRRVIATPWLGWVPRNYPDQGGVRATQLRSYAADPMMQV